jgi:hypothetical protein
MADLSSDTDLALPSSFEPVSRGQALLGLLGVSVASWTGFLSIAYGIYLLV